MYKTILLALYAAFTLVSCDVFAQSLEGGGVMLIGARTAAWVGGAKMPTARDYVQDGLIAMWDGIENAGYGVHDPNATVWKELINGNDALLQGNISFDDNHLVIRGGKAEFNPCEETQYVECIFKDGGQTYAQYVQFSIPTSGGRYVAVRANSCVIFQQQGKNYLIDRGNIVHATFDYIGKICNINGNGVEEFAVGGSFQTFFTGFGVYSERYNRGDIYALRLYNSALSDAKRLKNYAIDKARFGLT